MVSEGKYCYKGRVGGRVYNEQGSEGLPSATASENTTADRTSSHTPSTVQMTPQW